MRLDSWFDSFYVLGSLWGGADPQACLTRPPAMDIPRATAWAPHAEVTAFVEVNVVPMDTARVLPKHTVLVQDGRITALGPAGTIPVPAGAVRVDGRGKYLMPGLTDMHWHYLWEKYNARRLLYLASGVTAIRNNGGEFEKGEVLGPRISIFPGSGFLPLYIATQRPSVNDRLILPTHRSSQSPHPVNLTPRAEP